MDGFDGAATPGSGLFGHLRRSPVVADRGVFDYLSPLDLTRIGLTIQA